MNGVGSDPGLARGGSRKKGGWRGTRSDKRRWGGLGKRVGRSTVKSGEEFRDMTRSIEDGLGSTWKVLTNEVEDVEVPRRLS